MNLPFFPNTNGSQQNEVQRLVILHFSIIFDTFRGRP